MVWCWLIRWVVTLGVAVCCVGGALGQDGADYRSSIFSVPPELRPQVSFWKDIFAKYSKLQVVIHDTEHLDRIYSVLDFRGLVDQGLSAGQIEQYVAESTRREKERVRAVLINLDRVDAPGDLGAKDRRIWELFRDSRESRKFLHAAAEDRIRAQAGLRERFAAGIEIAHAYFPEMERIFREEGVPPEITRLPLIESCFNVKAYSKRGAAGVWQFIPSTGRLYLRIDDAIDERRDPLLATRAAARFLRSMYDDLGAWPLAITAYNHGPAGIARAVDRVGTRDIVTIIQRYQGPAFKFASRNFFPEFLAALEVERRHSEYFGPLRLRQPVATDRVRVPHYVSLDTVARCAEVEADVIAELNPSLSRGIIDGKQRIPGGYELRLPAGTRPRFERQYAALPEERRFSAQRALYRVHRVQRGQTLSTIAQRYGSTIEEIRRQNRLSKSQNVRVGQVLRIPGS